MKAWLVYWKHVDDQEDRLASILDPRLTPKAVADHIERLYADALYSLSERLDAARARPHKHNPYTATLNSREVLTNGIQGRKLVDVTCGHNPYLQAKKVEGLKVQENANGAQMLVWAKAAVR